MGLHRAFPDAEIVGVDIRPQPHYPFTFVHGDALDFVLDEFDFAWASPPVPPLHHTDIVAPLRRKLYEWGGAWIIENVIGAPLLFSATLCGLTFGLRVYRHRLFEAPFMLLAPPHQQHVLPALSHRHPQGLSRKEAFLAGLCFATVTGNAGSYAGPVGMGIDWMNGNELSQAVPPAYSEYLAQFIPLSAERGRARRLARLPPARFTGHPRGAAQSRPDVPACRGPRRRFRNPGFAAGSP